MAAGDADHLRVFADDKGRFLSMDKEFQIHMADAGGKWRMVHKDEGRLMGILGEGRFQPSQALWEVLPET